jgi:hypothetical protein
LIIVKLYGGLGNQMFQYAFGKSFSIRYGIPLKLDISSLFEYRKYEMDIFNLDTDIATKEDMLLFDRRNLSLGKRVLFKIKHCFLKPLYISEKEGLELFIFPKKVSKNVLISGYWQSEYFFKNIESDIRRDLLFPDITTESNMTFCSLIKQTNSVSLHIRRGDYLWNHNNNVHGVLPLKYYHQAIEYIIEKVFNPIFFIFSDDADWVKENLDINGSFYIISGNKNKLAYIDMQLMSYCKHNIIANSSFSWWGAWLNDYSDKIVIAPSQWFSHPFKNSLQKNIVPKEWISL